MSNTTAFHITDNHDALIDRKETQRKIDRLTVYLGKVNRRYKHLDVQMSRLTEGDAEDAKLIQKGLQLMRMRSEKESQQ